MNRALVLYHANCPDGFTAAWAVWKALGDKAEYRAVTYGQPPPDDIAGRRVILVDFSYPRAALDVLASVASSLDIYDHHKSAEADLKDWHPSCGGRVVFDMERSGAGIVWDSLHSGHRPKLIDYVEDADLWRFSLSNARKIREFLFSYPYRFDVWERISECLEK